MPTLEDLPNCLLVVAALYPRSRKVCLMKFALQVPLLLLQGYPWFLMRTSATITVERLIHLMHSDATLSKKPIGQNSSVLLCQTFWLPSFWSSNGDWNWAGDRATLQPTEQPVTADHIPFVSATGEQYWHIWHCNTMYMQECNTVSGHCAPCMHNSCRTLTYTRFMTSQVAVYKSVYISTLQFL